MNHQPTITDLQNAVCDTAANLIAAIAILVAMAAAALTHAANLLMEQAQAIASDSDDADCEIQNSIHDTTYHVPVNR